MGCGTSKAAQVVEEDITIKDYPTSSSPHRHPHAQSSDIPNESSNFTSDDSAEIIAEVSGQSAIERAVHDLTISEQRPGDQPDGTNEQGHEDAPLSSTDSLQRPIAFEVCMSNDGTRSPKKAPPRRLAKMDSTSKVTGEELAKKQKLVEERKQKELDKRANSKVSRKERLRKEVMAAREMELLQNGARILTEDPDKLKDKNDDKSQRNEFESSDYFQGSYDASAEMEVDSTYNTDQDQQLGIWEDNDVQDQTKIKAEQSKETDDDNFFDDQPLTNSLEQYM